MYDYREAITNDVLTYVRDEVDFNDFESLEDLEEYLNDVLWAEDSITGNASGSYTFNTWEAEKNLCHNMDLLQKALSEFGNTEALVMDFGAEAADVTIRCYLLGECIAAALDEVRGDFEAAHQVAAI